MKASADLRASRSSFAVSIPRRQPSFQNIEPQPTLQLYNNLHSFPRLPNDDVTMSTDKKIVEFPHAENKLQAPSKKSLFERQKAEQEVKRLREEAETKAVYEDFVKSFDDEDEPSAGLSGFSRDEGQKYGGGFSGGAPKRHFAPSGPGGGRGFGDGQRGGRMPSGVGSLGPPPGMAKKRTYEGFQRGERRDDRGLLAFDDYESEDRVTKRAGNREDDYENTREAERDEERAVPKPTLRLASLPPGTSPAVIKALMPVNLKVDSVRILPPSGPVVYTERRSMSAIVTLAKDTAANDIDTAVNGLQNRYLGYGYYLNLHRHLSSAAISSSSIIPTLGSVGASQPFGAKAVDVASAGRGHAPPPHQRGGFAPPSSYGPPAPQMNRGPLLHVPVQAPRDIKELKLIHKVIENLLTHGPEFEALLMSRPDVQREEKWAWIWDPRSTGGVWYRWRLWEVLTGSTTKRGQGKYLPLFEGSSAWKSPDQPLAYEYTTKLSEIVSDSEYNSSDDDESGDEGGNRRPQNHGAGGPPDPSSLVDDGKAYLNPLEKAKLTHLLSRLPTSKGKLRKGDVARVTAFAISHAGRGADEIVSMILSNIAKPFAYTSANPSSRREKAEREAEKDGSGAGIGANDEDEEDTSAASLIGLYLISDILSSSSTSGIRHAWRYRSLFESALKARHTFEDLGRMERKMGWGKLKAEKWKRSVGMVLGLWEGWCVFPVESQEGFVRGFSEPPKSRKEEDEERKKGDLERREEKSEGKRRWKAVEVEAKSAEQPDEAMGAAGDENLGDEEDLDGEPMDEDEDLDGEPMLDDEDEDADLDGAPMPMAEDEPILQDSAPPEQPVPAADGASLQSSIPIPIPIPAEQAGRKEGAERIPVGDTGQAGQQRRQRPRAVDMFADSDEE
ncbi:hypothetical protein VTL71DRAFT_6056 [Oculimacula yallundae]|uniref:CID domain-containing protein n=1 Tax=Oculimacula yallundae TaxID=86028 RepID=A0ABR4BZ96_9HELO